MNAGLLFAQSEKLTNHSSQKLQIHIPDSVNHQLFVDQFLQNKWASGYWFSGLDSINNDTAYFHVGNLYSQKKVLLSIHDDLAVQSWQTHLKTGKSWQRGLNDILGKYTNSGYPFAQMHWDSIDFHTGQAYLGLISGPRIIFDSICVQGSSPISKGFLQTVTDIHNGYIYSEAKVKSISGKLARLDGVYLQNSPQIFFENEKASVQLALQSENKSSFEGLVGIQSSPDNSQQTTLTGYINLHLNNLFKSSKMLDFQWNRFGNQSQTADIHYTHPYIMSAPMELDLKFGLIRQDTSFLSQSFLLNLNIFVWDKTDLLVGFQRSSGFLISPKHINLVQGVADFQNRIYHLGIQDARFNRSIQFGSFFHYFIDLAVGDKKITKNPSVDPVHYEDVRLKSLITQFNSTVKYQFPVYQKLAFYHQLSGKVLVNDAILTNELDRLGGFKTIRGFDEKTFYGQNHFISNMELRQYFRPSSFLMLLYDFGWLLNQNVEELIIHGFGAGLTLQTSNGLFTFATALGKVNESSFNPAALKVHIGYTSVF